MRRLLDIGMGKLRELVNDMGRKCLEILADVGKISEEEAYNVSQDLKRIRIEVLDISTELLVRYSPVATDLRFIQGVIDISYDLYRISRYVMEISRTVEIVGLEKLPGAVERGIEISTKAVEKAIDAFSKLDEVIVGEILELDDEMDDIYIESLKNIKKDDECTVTALITRHLERICDHAKEIGERVIYIKEGKRL